MGKILFFNSANKIFMYKNAKVTYKDIELTADYIELNMIVILYMQQETRLNRNDCR